MTLRLVTPHNDQHPAGQITTNHATSVNGPWTPTTHTSWASLLSHLQIHHPPEHHRKTDAPLWYAGTLRGTRKRDTDITARTLVTLDYDHASADWQDTTRTALTGLRWAAHTTWTHNPDPAAIGQHRWRLIIPLNHPHTPTEYTRLTDAISRAIPGADPARIGQAMYTPTARPGYAWEIGDGQPLDWDTWTHHHPPTSAAERDEYAHRAVTQELSRLDQLDLLGWAGPPWDDTSYATAVAIIEICRAPWNTLDEEQLRDEWMRRAPTDPDFTTADHQRIWQSASRHITETGARPLPDRFQIDYADDQDQQMVVAGLPMLDITNASNASRWLMINTGKPDGPLSTIYRRAGQLVALATTNAESMLLPGTDQPAPLIPVTLGAYIGIVHAHMQPRIWRRGAWADARLTRDIASDPVSAPHTLTNARDLAGTSQTPWITQTGQLVCESGWDPASRVLTQLTGQLQRWDWAAAAPRLDQRAARAGGQQWVDLLAEFGWEAPRDQATYLALALTPLIRGWTLDAGGRWPLGLITAHTPGSGKTLLANILQALHGGTTHPLPEGRGGSEEIRKMIMSILIGGGDTGRIVLLDNARHLSSPALDGLLTSGEWTDRILGRTETSSAANDRLWLATGNNLSVGGDLARRCVWVHVDPGVPHPETRTGFRLPNILGYVRDHRAQLLDALLTMTLSWHQNAATDQQLPPGGDNFTAWRHITQAVLSWSDIPGAETLHDQNTTADEYLPDPAEEQASAVLATIWHTHQEEPWTTKELLDHPDLQPRIAEHLETMTATTLGKWLRNRSGRWWQGVWRVQPVGAKKGPPSRRNATLWKVEKHPEN